MRRVLIWASFVILMSALYFSWAYRYERDPEQPVWRLQNLRSILPAGHGIEWKGRPGHEKLSVRVDDETPRVVVDLALPGVQAVEGLHFRFRMNSHGLLPGDEKWKDGRLMVGWQSGDGAVKDYEPVGSIQLDGETEWESFVIQPNRPPATPLLRLEHLGRAGEFELSELEITAVRERAIWKVGRWILALAGWIWGAVALQYGFGVSRWRAHAASFVWMMMAIHFVIPGPWKQQRPIGNRFQIGREQAFVVNKNTESPVYSGLAQASGNLQSSRPAKPLKSMGKLPEQGSIALRVKHQVASARPLLHALLLFAPTWVFAFLLGRRLAMGLAAALAVCIEVAQIAFAYGFDWHDVFDLICDAAGIAAALWCHSKLWRMLEKQKIARW